MIDLSLLTEEQKLQIVREYRNKKAKEWRDKNREKRNAYCREWHRKNKQHRNEYMKEWNRKRKEREDCDRG